MSELRVALIGYGLAGRWFHAPLLSANPDLRLTEVVTSNPERRRQALDDHPGVRVVAEVEELWDEPLPQLVVVASTNATHVPLAMAAVERGVAVVVDKPLGVSSGEAQMLVRAAQRAGVLLTVFQNRRWDSDQLTLRRLIEEDRIGRVLRFESRFERWRPQADADAWRVADAAQGGQLLDLGSHLVDQAIQLLGPVTHLYAEISSLRGLPADDDAFLALHHAGGAVSHLHASALTAVPGPRLQVLGSRAAFVVQELDSQEQALRDGRRPDTESDWGEEPRQAWGQLISGEGEEPVRSERGDWPAFYRQLVRALRDGVAPPVDPWDAVETLRILDLARHSSAVRRVVALTA